MAVLPSKSYPRVIGQMSMLSVGYRQMIFRRSIPMATVVMMLSMISPLWLLGAVLVVAARQIRRDEQRSHQRALLVQQYRDAP